MFTLPGNIKVLNLPEQVEKNAKDIVGLNQKDKLTDDALASFNIILNSQINKVYKLENDIADLNQKSEYADTNIINLQSQTASNATKISTLENNITSPDGTITTGSLDVKNNATFGKVIVNSADDITDKDGNAIVKNESLEEFKRKYFETEARFKYANKSINIREEATNTPFDGQYTDVSEMYSHSKFMDQTYTAVVANIPNYSSATKANGFCDSLDASEIVLGGFSPNGVNLAWGFNGTTAKKITLAEGAVVKPTTISFCFVSNATEEIGSFDLSLIDKPSGLQGAFYAAIALKHIHCKHFKFSFNISYSTAFETADLVEIISNLDPVSTPQTLTMGATNLAKLTQDQILVANVKRWTLA